jgi:D-sedoheptulose 7-phosphate isomerase
MKGQGLFMPIDLSQIETIVNIFKQSNFIWIIGNGGSAAQADHFACDLVKNAKKRAISLTNFSVGSAISNDMDFVHIFRNQLEVFFDLKKDVLLCISTSGESNNLIKAAHYIFTKGGKVVTITGTIEDEKGGMLRDFSTNFIVVDNNDQQRCEDIFGAICHKIYKGLK